MKLYEYEEVDGFYRILSRGKVILKGIEMKEIAYKITNELNKAYDKGFSDAKEGLFECFFPF